MMDGKQLGFADYEQTTAKKRTKNGEVPDRNGSGCALAALA